MSDQDTLVLLCGCVIHKESNEVVGCPVAQIERLNQLVSDLGKQVENIRGDFGLTVERPVRFIGVKFEEG